tara:strand:- start:5300 stop:5983 length:684 start_codon:yes stop_codon:yes gene_type:complete
MGKPKGESRGLAYLQQARPEAVRHLLKFFGESGRNLEPRTRFLISIVTKVINFSPRGLQQYVPRALKEGASAAEIIDAVLCSYPCAGLTRVVDALDVILDMGLPEFEIPGEEPGLPAEDAPADPEEGEWREIARREDFSKDGRLEVNVGDRCLAAFDIDGEVLVIDGLCPHRSGPLIRGQLEGKVVTCPIHHWQFDLESGVSQDNPGAKVGTYEVRVEDDGRILVRF